MSMVRYLWRYENSIKASGHSQPITSLLCGQHETVIFALSKQVLPPSGESTKGCGVRFIRTAHGVSYKALEI
jgi:hypothetical protein